MSIDWNKPIRRSNSEAEDKYRVLCTDRKGGSPVVLLNETSGCVLSVTRDGKYEVRPDMEPLFENIPETVEIDVWINVYAGGAITSYTRKTDANRMAGNDRIACINVKRTVEVGEGLNK